VKSHTAYLTFETRERRELIRITEEVQAAVDPAGIEEGMVLVSAMHITAGVWVNDDEPGLHEDVIEWLDKGDGRVTRSGSQPPGTLQTSNPISFARRSRSASSASRRSRAASTAAVSSFLAAASPCLSVA
jgi:Uncharacterised protein family UPF0047